MTDTVHVYAVSLQQPAERVPACALILAPDERERAARFVFERDRRRYTVARWALRMILARYVDVPPGELEFRYGPRGKPALRGPASLCFNASHSGELAVVGVARGRELGIDIEWVRPVEDALGIAEQFFCEAEHASLRAAQGVDRLATFFRYWTRKEAILKATGEGLGLPLNCVDVGWPSSPSAVVHPVQVQDASAVTRHFGVLDLSVSDGFNSAIAVEGSPGWRLEHQRLAESLYL